MGKLIHLLELLSRIEFGKFIFICILIAFCILIIVFRKPISRYIDRINKVKTVAADGRETIIDSSNALEPPQRDKKLEQKQLQALVGNNEAKKQSLHLEGFAKYHMEILEATFEARDTEKVKAIYKKWKALPDQNINEEVLQRVMYESLIELNYNQIPAELKELESHKDWFFPSIQLATYYLSQGVIRNAEKHADIALDRAKTPDDYSEYYLKYAEIMEVRGESIEDIISYLKDTLGKADKSLKYAAVNLYEKVAKLKEESGDLTGKHLALENALQINPDGFIGVSLREKLAFSYAESEASNDKLLALHHYEILLKLDSKNPRYLNNAAILCGDLGLNEKKDFYLNQAEDLDDDYGKGNTIIFLTQSGFFKRAEEVLNNTPDNLQINGTRTREARNLLEKSKEREAKKYEQTKNNSQLYHSYIQKLINKNFKKLGIKEIQGKWTDSNKNELTLKSDNTSKSLKGKHIVYTQGEESEKYSIEGKVDNNILSLKMTRGGSLNTLLAIPRTKSYTLFLKNENQLVGLKDEDGINFEKASFKRSS